MENYFYDDSNCDLEGKDNNNSLRNMKIPDLSDYFINGDRAYKSAVEYDFGNEIDKKYAIVLYSYAASQGNKKALYTLINMAMEETEYFIDVPALIYGGGI